MQYKVIPKDFFVSVVLESNTIKTKAEEFNRATY